MNRKLSLLLLAVVLCLVPSAEAFVVGLSPDDLDIYSQNGIMFYDPTEDQCEVAPVTGNKVTVIGDSISYGARSEFDKQLSGVDYADKVYNGTKYQITQVSKHFSANADDNYSGLTIARQMKEQGDLRPYVVFALGTNDPGAVTADTIDELVKEIGTNHKIVLVTNYAYDNKLDYSVNNSAIREAEKKYSGKVVVADWEKIASASGDGLLADAYVHPNAEGNQKFVETIVSALKKIGSNSTTGLSGNNTNYAGAQVWSDAEMSAIQANRAIYEEAATKFNFPWQVMAVLHSHETGLRRYNPANGQGVYQLYSYTNGGTNANRFAPADSISEEEFRRQTLIAAEVVSGMVGDLNNPDNVKKLFFRYNGVAGQYINKALSMGFTQEQAENGEGSAYVMNRYDARRDPTTSEMSPYWPGRFEYDGVYNSSATTNGFGAFVQYEAIAGTGSCHTSNGKIADTAIELSWLGHGHSIADPKPEYVEAMKAAGTYIPPCGGNGVCPPYGASCDQFVSTVVRYSGADPDFPVFGPGRQADYMDNHPEMYERIIGADLSILQPGDIFVHYDQHIYIYLGMVDGEIMQASASWNDRTGEHYPYLETFPSYYRIYRRINY